MRYLALVAIFGAAVAVPHQSQRIVGGADTDIERFPYMANMQFAWLNNWWSQASGGTLITNYAVLTAAHCYYGDQPTSWRVLLGTSQASSGGTAHRVSQLVHHPGFNALTLDNDIAIVRLVDPATFSNTVGVARIAGPLYVLPAGTPVTAIGWGAHSYQGSFSDQLQNVVINTVDQQLCADRYSWLKTQPGFANWPDVTEGMLCAGLNEGGRACAGDVGGPLIHDSDVVMGITSWAYRCGDDGFPGVSTRVSRHVDWIVATA